MCLKDGDGSHGHWTFLKISTKDDGTDEYRFYNNTDGNHNGVVKRARDIKKILKKRMHSGLELVYSQIETPSEDIITRLNAIDQRVSRNQLNEGESIATFLRDVVNPEATRRQEVYNQMLAQRRNASASGKRRKKKKKSKNKKRLSRSATVTTTQPVEHKMGINFSRAAKNCFKGDNLLRKKDRQALRYKAQAAKERIDNYITMLSRQLREREGEGINLLHELMKNKGEGGTFMDELRRVLPKDSRILQIFEHVESIYFETGFDAKLIDNLLFAGRLLYITKQEQTPSAKIGLMKKIHYASSRNQVKQVASKKQVSFKVLADLLHNADANLEQLLERLSVAQRT